jgi:hypothetical protein
MLQQQHHHDLRQIQGRRASGHDLLQRRCPTRLVTGHRLVHTKAAAGSCSRAAVQHDQQSRRKCLSNLNVFVAARAELDQAGLGSGVCCCMPAAVPLLLEGSGVSAILSVDAGACASRCYLSRRSL